MFVFSIADSKKYLNGKLESNTRYAVFQRSFDDYGSYDSERFIFFKTKKSFPLVTVTVIVLVVVIVAAVLIAIALHFGICGECDLAFSLCPPRKKGQWSYV